MKGSARSAPGASFPRSSRSEPELAYSSIHARAMGSHQDHRVRGLVLMAPHFFVEAEGLAEIRNARSAYETTDLRARLARHHSDVDAAFRGWNEAWLDPQFERTFDITDALAYIRVPIL